MLFALGLLRLGALAQFLSHPVISGFISGAALLIIIGQLRPLLGVSVHGESAAAIVLGIAKVLNDINVLAASIGLVTLAVLLAAKRWLGKALTKLGLGKDTAELLAKLAPMLLVVISIVTVSLMEWESQLSV